MRAPFPLLALVICLPLGGCDQSEGEGITRIALVTIDGLAHPRHGGLGPFEDWSQGGLRFSRVNAASNWAVPSLATLLTGRNGRDHGLTDLEGARCSQDLVTLAEVMSAANWTCRAVLSDRFLSEPRGLDQGFETWSLVAGESSLIASQGALDSGLAQLRAAQGPCFIWLHLSGPRPPYGAPDSWSADCALQPGQSLERMLKLVRDADHELRNDLIALHLHDQALLLESLGVWLDQIDKETLVVLVGTNGFELGEQGRLGSGTSMGEEALAVPFLLLGPGLPVGQVQRRVGHVDLMPTLLDLSRLRGPHDLGGISILPGREAPWRPLFSSTSRAHPRDVVYEEGLKLLRDGETGGVSLYDLDRDPDERMIHGSRLGSDRTRLRQVLLDHLELP